VRRKVKTNLCCHQGLVAIASSNGAFIFAIRATALKLKRPKQEKVTKNALGAAPIFETPWRAELWQEESLSCCRRKITRELFRMVQLHRRDLSRSEAPTNVVHILREMNERGRFRP
jgi:hypothetical protein